MPGALSSSSKCAGIIDGLLWFVHCIRRRSIRARAFSVYFWLFSISKQLKSDSLRRQALADANPAEALDIAGNIEPESSVGNSDATDSEEEPEDRPKAEAGTNSGKYHRTSGRGDTPMLDKFGNDMTRAAAVFC